jgi:hypothetical protein
MAETQEITPALSAEEWANMALSGTRRRTDEEIMHASAAIMLYGQPFGFTHEDVTLLRIALQVWPNLTGDGAEAIASLRDRIAALLPPEEAQCAGCNKDSHLGHRGT